MDGLVTLRELRARRHNMPVIMCSSLTQRGATVTIEALASGASDYVAKPTGQAGREAAIAGAGAGTDPQDSRPHLPACSASRRSRRASPPVAAHASRAAAARPPAVPASRRSWPSASPPAARPRSTCSSRSFPQTFRFRFSSCSTCPKCSRACSPSASAAVALCGCARPPKACPSSPGTIYIARGNWHMEALAARASRSAGHPAPYPGPAGKSLPPRRGRALSLRGPASTAPACSPWSSPAWATTASPAAASSAHKAAACWPRIRPPARSGECPAP